MDCNGIDCILITSKPYREELEADDASNEFLENFGWRTDEMNAEVKQMVCILEHFDCNWLYNFLNCKYNTQNTYGQSKIYPYQWFKTFRHTINVYNKLVCTFFTRENHLS